ncbi:class C sortase [Hespellia stercorisuis]|uniref:Sortase A n=1 Tax=Hespellia stercorisuis DSM 15480 TaxID=1121950 RepID=A0A1M6I2U7_9FIRM|nr:class C sortase [Hespellia stercorisuis]SHJ28797.1 sortase A [Hespellia stercorisuis DSM 15480]
MKKKCFDPISVIIILAGLVILAYPFVSNYLLEKNSSKAVGSYEEALANLTDEEAERILEEARNYNEQLFARNGSELPSNESTGTDNLEETYWNILNITDSGMMGYITIPRLDETMPIYHGSAEEVLQVGVGHLQYTSFPVGGESTHAALSGHRGLTSAKLFTDLDQMKTGDRFYLHILKETFAYEVNQIVTVEPNQLNELSISPGEDYVTLVTCTPYGINSHRLLVRGTRIPYEEKTEEEDVKNAGFFISRQYLYPIIGAAVLFLFFILQKIVSKVKRKG